MPTYRTAHRKSLAKRSSRRPVYGRGEDAGRYYRCWNCGFVCDSKRDALGGADSAGGDNHQDYALQAGANYRAGIGPRPVGTLDNMLHFHVAMRQTVPAVIGEIAYAKFGDEILTFGTEQLEMGLYGEETVAGSAVPESVYHHHKTNITAGCPFCGSTNWRGDY